MTILQSIDPKKPMKPLLLLTVALVAASCLATAYGGPGFQAAADGGFTFDTGVLRGKLRAGGKSVGLTEVIHVPSGTRLDRGQGLFSHYRVFTRGRRYGGGAWDWPSTATLRPDGAVEVLFPPAEGRPIEMKAVYRWADPATLDLETTVRAVEDLPAFESFLASYFTEGFTNALAYVQSASGTAPQPGFLAAEKSAADWHMFPRDAVATALIQDGRWQLEPHPVTWSIRPFLAWPLAIRRAPAVDLVAVLMAPATDCFAVASPFETEGHYSTYLSLFGRDIKAGETVRARARIVIAAGAADARCIRLSEQVHCVQRANNVRFSVRECWGQPADAGRHCLRQSLRARRPHRVQAARTGSAASPVLFRSLVIINASTESGWLVALDQQTGREIWRAGGGPAL